MDETTSPADTVTAENTTSSTETSDPADAASLRQDEEPQKPLSSINSGSFDLERRDSDSLRPSYKHK